MPETEKKPKAQKPDKLGEKPRAANPDLRPASREGLRYARSDMPARKIEKR